MKKILQKIGQLLEKAQAMVLTDSQAELAGSIDRFCGFMLDMDNTLGNADYVISRIRNITSDAETVEEFVRWTFESISQDAYTVARNWFRGMSEDTVLFFNQDTCQLVTEEELGTLDLEEFGMSFSGNLTSCLQYVCSLLENITTSETDGLPVLSEDEIEDIRTLLSQAKEECFDGVRWEEEPLLDKDMRQWTDEDHRRHSQWSAESWNRFDDLAIEELGEQDGALRQLIACIGQRKNGAKISDIYDMLSQIEENGRTA